MPSSSWVGRWFDLRGQGEPWTFDIRRAVQRRDSIRSLSVTTTHALYPLKVQRKVSNDVAGLAAAASSLDPPKSAISAISE
jgi:hypothetical protein